MSITEHQIITAAASTGLIPKIEGYNGDHPLAIVLKSKGQNLADIYDYFGREVVHDFNMGLFAKPSKFANKIDDYKVGLVIRSKILDGSITQCTG